MRPDPTLETTLRAVEPAARLVAERHLLKVLEYLRDRDRPVPLNPDLPLWVERDVLAASGVVPAAVLDGAPARVLLVTDPAARDLDYAPPADRLRAYWRVLFQAAVMNEVDRRVASGALDSARCADLLGRFGEPCRREIRYVLETDHTADRAADAVAHFRAFAAVYLDLLQFDPHGVAAVFPSLPPADVVTAVLGEQLDVATLLSRSRPAGSPDSIGSGEAHAPEVARPAAATPAGGELDPLERAGNFVRAANRYTRAGETQRAEAALARLIDAVAAVTGWDDHERAKWHVALVPLLGPAAAGEWSRAARCLYELQKIPGDAGREVYAVDLAETIRTLGRRPVKRPLPHARLVILLMRLRAAHGQLLRGRAGHADRSAALELLAHEVHRTEDRVRADLGPVVVAALDAAGLRPANRVEAVARDKVVAELLDRACVRGRLRIGDLRDAIARNQRKMPDLAGPGEWLRGDPLLRADARLALDLDGVYRRGEFYLRWLQRGSSVFFGTRVGRLLFLYLVLPFAASFMSVVFAQEMGHIGGNAYRFVSKILAPRPAAAAEPGKTVPATTPAAVPAPPDDKVEADEVAVDEETGEVINIDPHETERLAREVFGSSAATAERQEEFRVPWEYVGPLTLVFLILLHVPAARHAVATAVLLVWRAVRFVMWDVPRAVWNAPPVKAVRHSRVVWLFRTYLGPAVVVTTAVALVMEILGAPLWRVLRWGGIVLAATAIVSNTPWGWVVQERLATRLADGLRLLRVNLLRGLVAWIVGGFRWLANWFEAQLYRVDEWLRFRGGDSSGSLAIKAALGLLWFPVAYFFRFAFYLLLEPQINPVKHFPVVTVSHKLLLPMVATKAPQTEASMLGAVVHQQFGWSIGSANFWAFWGIAAIPGIFGFIAWELMANWRLYRANRPARLKPVVVGSHGESVRGLLRPGFHSGTVPRLYRKLRKAQRRGDRAAAGRIEHDLEHAAEGVDRFVRRELLPLLAGSPHWDRHAITNVAVRFGCQRVAVGLAAPTLGPDPFVFALENLDGAIEASVERAGWADKLTEAQRVAFTAAVRGVFDMSAATLFEGLPRTPHADAELGRPWTWADWAGWWETAR